MGTTRLIMISGWAHDASILRPLRSDLEGRAECSLYSLTELARYAREQMNIKTISVDSPPTTYARVVKTIIGDSEVAVLGFSLGGMVALEVARFAPGCVSKVIMVSSCPRFTQSADYPVGVAPASLAHLKDQVTKNSDQGLLQFFQMAESPDSMSFIEQRAKIDGAHALPKEDLLDGLTYLEKIDLTKELSKISVPVLLVHGKDDAIIRSEASQFIGSKIKGSKVVVKVKAGHNMIQRQSFELAREIGDFLK